MRTSAPDLAAILLHVEVPSKNGLLGEPRRRRGLVTRLSTASLMSRARATASAPTGALAPATKTRFERDPLDGKCGHLPTEEPFDWCVYVLGADKCVLVHGDHVINPLNDIGYDVHCTKIEAFALPGTNSMAVSQHSGWPRLVVGDQLGDPLPSEARASGGPRLWIAIAMLGLLATAGSRLVLFRRSARIDALTPRYHLLALVAACGPSVLAFASWPIHAGLARRARVSPAVVGGKPSTRGNLGLQLEGGAVPTATTLAPQTIEVPSATVSDASIAPLERAK